MTLKQVVRNCIGDEMPGDDVFENVVVHRMPGDLYSLFTQAARIKESECFILVERNDKPIMGLPRSAADSDALLRQLEVIKDATPPPVTPARVATDFAGQIAAEIRNSPAFDSLIRSREVSDAVARGYVDHVLTPLFEGPKGEKHREVVIIADCQTTHSTTFGRAFRHPRHDLMERLLYESRAYPPADISVRESGAPFPGFCTLVSKLDAPESTFFTKLPGQDSAFAKALGKRGRYRYLRNAARKIIGIEAERGGLHVALIDMPLDLATKHVTRDFIEKYVGVTVTTAACQPAKAKVEQLFRDRGMTNPLVGESGALVRMYPAILMAVEHPTLHVMVVGETGTGKEVVYELLRCLAPPGQPFEIRQFSSMDGNTLKSEVFGHVVGSFSGATKERGGAVEKAQGGMLVLDNVQTSQPDVFADLLRLLQPGQPYRKFGGDEEKHADCRIVVGFNVLPEKMEREGKMPPDWMARFDIRIDIPPLDARREDIPLLVRAFTTQFMNGDDVKGRGLSVKEVEPPEEQVQAWMAQSWGGAAGNVRGLRKAVRAYLRQRLQDSGHEPRNAEPDKPKKKTGRPPVRDISDENLIALLRQVSFEPSGWTAEKLFKQIDMRIRHGGKQRMKRTWGNLQTRIRHIKPEVLLHGWPGTGTPAERRKQIYELLRNLPGFMKLPR